VAIFAPHASIWNSTAANTYLMKSLSERFDVIFVSCGKLLTSRCASMDEAGYYEVPSQEALANLCNFCVERAVLAAEEGRVNHHKLSQYLTADETSQAQRIAEKATTTDWVTLEAFGLPVGSYSAYDFGIRHKFYGDEIPESILGDYKQQLLSTVQTGFAWHRFLESNKIDAVIVENEFYATSRVTAELARRQGIPAWSLVHGTSLARFGRSFALTSKPRQWFELNKTSHWKDFRHSRLSLSTIREWLITVTEGSSPWVYSSKFRGTPAAKVSKLLGLAEGTEVALALTSSPDEPLAADRAKVRRESFSSNEGGKFKNQLEWLRYLIANYKERPEQFLVVRMHPRLMPNKREKATSPFAIELLELERSAPSNVIFNTPQSDVSLWDIFGICDRVFNYSSTAGLEGVMAGLPVIQYDSEVLHAYPPELNHIGDGSTEFNVHFDHGDSAALWLKIENAYKWLGWKFVEFTANPDSKIPDRQAISIQRIINWAYLRKGLHFVRPLLRVLERRELRSQTEDQIFSRLLSELLSSELSGFQDVVWPKSDPLGTDDEIVKSFHGQALSKILGSQYSVVASRLHTPSK
jgi:hypothetical protein